jgi:hypothetical protein
MRNPQGMNQVHSFGQQVFPRNLRDFMSAYMDATEPLFGFIFVDLHPRSIPVLRLRTDIFDQNIIYQF